MTAEEWHAQHAPGYVRDLARRQQDDYAERPWVVLAYRRNPGQFYGVTIVSGYNRYTGESISWRVPSFDDQPDRWDLSGAVEVT